MNEDILKKIDGIALYTVIYAAVFMFIYLTLPYILPLVLGAIIAFLAQWPINFIEKKTKVKRRIVAIVVVLIIFGIISAVLSFAIASIVSELVSLSSILPELYNEFKVEAYRYLDLGAQYFQSIDPAIIESIKGNASRIFSGSFTVAVFIVNFLLNILKSLPGLVMLILFTLISGVYLAMDLPMIKKSFYSLFTKEDGKTARNFLIEANKMLGGYIRAYFIVISVTFIETLIGTQILRIKYSILLSLVTSISDMLPVLGPGTVLIPTGIVYLLSGDLVKGIGMLVIYVVTLVVRQVLEPRIVSSSLGIYPLAILMAIFIGLKVYGFVGMFFCIFYVVFFMVFRNVKLI
ncbi:hypothetical protein OXPF_37100 [Oxobacter pfennigii]|uniref:Pheromone autoinducer 2 transporter n=1 Tax=Oxobacter pfennigii TaxID=36849 RepID=A0A0P8Y8C2_9CLOT|nr:sporulation integral membrane protein YtvI [Oxobacter pfennigii]KPU42941.1 hypothetical protein OXPF_37100 [Oxobacter pfennigii]